MYLQCKLCDFNCVLSGIMQNHFNVYHTRCSVRKFAYRVPKPIPNKGLHN